jgi:putative FmdB family regulatory protein
MSSPSARNLPDAAMPIYEFYCETCHRLFRFLSRTVEVERRPACPRCGRERLERRPSTFAVSRGRREPDGAGPPGAGDARLEAALAALAGEAERLPDDDPRAAARMMRRLFETAGLPVGEGMEEALARMESGEDPDEVEAQLGDALDDFGDGVGGAGEADDAPGGARRLALLRRRMLPPAVDDRLYEM